MDGLGPPAVCVALEELRQRIHADALDEPRRALGSDAPDADILAADREENRRTQRSALDERAFVFPDDHAKRG